jgi:hypothetical protein
MSRWWILPLAACIAFAGCGGDDDAASTATTTTARPGATTEQYASVVSEHSAEIQTWIDDEQSCTELACSFAANVYQRYVNLRQSLVGFSAALAELDDPPAEIAPLVERTERQVNDAVISVDGMVSCGRINPGSFLDSCGEKWTAAEASYRTLPALFAAWQPYV